MKIKVQEYDGVFEVDLCDGVCDRSVFRTGNKQLAEIVGNAVVQAVEHIAETLTDSRPQCDDTCLEWDMPKKGGSR